MTVLLSFEEKTDDARACAQSGHCPNALMSKLDLSDAFRHILVDPRDWELLGSTWPLVLSDGSTRTGYFFDMFLPFGLRSSPAIFLNLLTVCDTRWRSAVLTPFETTSMIFELVALLPQTPLALRILMLCFVPVLTSDLLPIHSKQFLLQRASCFLASQLDTVSQELRIDPTCLSEIIDLLDACSTKRHCTKRQLQSLIELGERNKNIF